MDKNQFKCPKCGEIHNFHIIPQLKEHKKYRGFLGLCIFLTCAFLITAIVLRFKLLSEGLDFFGSLEDSILKLGNNYLIYHFMNICSSLGGGLALISFLLLLLRPTEYKIQLKGYCLECQYIWKISTFIESDEERRQKAIAEIFNKKYTSPQKEEEESEKRKNAIEKIMNQK